MLQRQSLDRFPADAEGRHHDQHRDRRACDRLGPGVSVRMLVIRRLLGDPHGEQDDDRRDDVAQRVDGIGDQGERIADDPADQLGQPQDQVDDQPQPGRLPDLAVESLGSGGYRSRLWGGKRGDDGDLSCVIGQIVVGHRPGHGRDAVFNRK